MKTIKAPKEIHAFSDQSNDKGYFTITPRIVLAMCRNPFDYALWSVVKDIAGETRECYIGAKNLAKLAMMSPGQVQNSRGYLLSVRLLCGEKKFNEGISHDIWHLWVPDLWAANLKWCEEYRTIESRIAFKSRQSIEQVEPLQPTLIDQTLPFIDDEIPDGGSATPRPSVPHQSTEYHGIALSTTPNQVTVTPKYSVPYSGVKEEQALTEEKQKEQSCSDSAEGKPDYARLWEAALSTLGMQLTTTTVNTYLRDTQVANEQCNGKLVVRLTHSRLGHLDIINGRLRPLIERAVKDAAGREIEIEFIPKDR